MDCIKQILKLNIPTKKTNKYYLLSEEIAKITKTKPLRWIRTCKKNPVVFEKTITELKDLIEHTQVRNRSAYFIWLLKKNKV